MEEAYDFIRNIASEGGNILFVWQKKQAQESIQEEAQRCGMFFVNQRWLSGMLTNFKTLSAKGWTGFTSLNKWNKTRV